jgi:thiamine biosynthesis protein ThiI
MRIHQQRLRHFTNLDSVIVRFGGEIGIKSEWTRQAYEKLLLKNVKNTLFHFGLAPEAIARRRGRIYVETRKARETAMQLTRVFGISSVSPAIKTTSDMPTLAITALSVADSTIKEGTSFAVRCNRVGTHLYSSMDICREIGRQILEDLKGRNLHVDLTNPQCTVAIEVWEKEAFVYTETFQAAGGFPVGSQGKVVCLLSGGIDSPVAFWLAMKRGCTVTPIYLDNTPLTDETSTQKALEIAKRLFEWSIGYSTKMYIIPHGQNLETYMNKAPTKLTCLLCKRIMYRIAERIADVEKAEGIVTGEAIGEQASQTITNLRVLDEAAVKYPIHRPLLGFDKVETEALARKIGTLGISTRKAKGCCAAPSQPATRAKLERVKKAEEGLEIEKMVEESVKAAKTVIVQLDETY